MDIDTYEMLVDSIDQLEDMVEDLDDLYDPDSLVFKEQQTLLSRIETKCKMLECSYVTGIVFISAPYVVERHDSLMEYLHGIVRRYHREYTRVGKRYGYTYSN